MPFLLRSRQQRGELTQIECESGGRPGATEGLANAIVAFTAADGIGLAGGEHGETRAGLVVITAKVGEIDVQCLDLGFGRRGERRQRGERAGNRGGIGQARARCGQDFMGGPIQRWQRGKGVAPRTGQPGA